MTMGELYKFAIRKGMSLDPQGAETLEAQMARCREEYEALPDDKKWTFEKERCKNPFGDTRILVGDPDTELHRILVGIDILSTEILLAAALTASGQKIDMVLSHHASALAGDLASPMDIYINPKFAAHLLDRMAQDLEYKAVRLAKMGVDVLGCGDDMGHERQLFMRPEMLRKWILSRWERIIGAAKAIKPDIKVDFHTDGRSEEMIPDLMAIGVTAINPVQPECDDPEHLKQKFGRKLVLKGTLSSWVLTFGTPEEVKAEIRTRMETAKRWGGMMITPNNCPDVNTPYENFRAFLDACEEYGQYANS